ncbi:MAG: hypothetical protein OQK69_11015 [Gammaproteobacteria bacterium]|nr:hypothetical protein [Gammaproteobacteria bacterium]
MRKLIFALALGVILVPNHGFTLGLGDIEVNSSLNQKLTARIALLSAAPEDAESLIVKLASREEFTRAGLDRPLMLSSLKFRTSVEDGQVYIDVLSPKPIREPFLNFLVEVDWPKGHLIREYTILLDPPVFMRQKQVVAADSGRPAMQESTSDAPVAAQSSSEVSAMSSAVAPLESVESDAPAAVAEMYAPEPVQQTSVAASEHRIQEGDTAWSLANSMKPDDSISTQQMMMAMLRANPEVFIEGNVNGLKRGYILRTPEYDEMTAMSHEEARAMVIQQNALWREYQQTLSSEMPASAIDDGYEESEYSSEVAIGDESRLSIVSAGGGSSASGEMRDPSEMTADELREQLALSREREETERVEKEVLQEQVGSLTTQVDKMKGLLTIEDEAMAEIQDAATPADEEALVIDDSGDQTMVEETVAELADEQQAIDALDALTEESETEENLEVGTEELFVDETGTDEEVEDVAGQEVMDEVAPVHTPQPEPGLIDILLNNRLILGGLLVALLILGAVGYLIKRRRDGAAAGAEEASSEPFGTIEEDILEDVADMVDDESVEEVVTDEEVETSMAEAEAEAEEEFDAEATMILPSGTDTVVTPAASLQAEEEQEQDDVTAEADVYLAYGIYQQAEELLENAIKENPDKDIYRVKLAETYFAGKNAEAFEKLGAEMKQRLGDEETPAWAKVAAMGKELCPDVEIFQQAGADASLDLDDMMPKSPEPMDLDLGDDSADSVGELDLDFDSPADDSVAEAGFELPSMDETAVISPDETAILSTETESSDELEFDLGETGAIEETPAEEEEFSLDIEASELDLETAGEVTEEAADDAGLDMDFDMSMDTEAEPEAASDDVALEMDLDMSMDTEAEPEVPSDDADLDLSMEMEEAVEEMDADLDLSMEDIAVEEPLEEVAEVDISADAGLDMSMDDDLSDVDLSEPVDVDEINTKLDLARAYLDMGDHEGARDILDEVLAGGNADQKKEATELMAQAG